HDLVALRKSAKHLNRVHRTAAQLHLRAGRFASRRIELEESDGALLLAERRPSDKQDVIQTLEFNRAVDAEVGPRAARQLALELDVHGDRAVLRGGVDTNHFAGDDAVAGVDRGNLSDGQ